MASDTAARERFPWAFVLLLAVLLAARYREFTFRAEPLLDERVYVAAGRAMLVGASPFDSEYLYLPAFAWLAGKFFAFFGEGAFLALLRVANLAAAAFFAWLGVAKSGLGYRPRCLLAAAFLLLSPAVLSSIGTGNPTFLVGLLVFGALELASRRPLAAGSLLGLSLLIKPLAPGAVAWIAGCRTKGRFWGLAAAAVALLFFVAGFLPPELTGAFLRQVPPLHAAEHNPSFYRLLESAGLVVPPALFTGAICLAALALSARRERPPEGIYLWALPAMFLASPLVWNHTLCLSWPIQAAALGLAWRRRRPLELAAVSCGILLLAFWHGIHALPHDAAFARWIFTAAPALAPVALAAYVLRLAKDGGS